MIDARVRGYLEIHVYRPSPGFPTVLRGWRQWPSWNDDLSSHPDRAIPCGGSTKLLLALVIAVCNGLDPPDFTSVFSDCTVAGEFSAARHVQHCLLRPQELILEVPAHVCLCREIGVKVSKVEIEIALLKQGCDDRLKQAWLAGTKAV